MATMESVIRQWVECWNKKDWQGCLRFHDFPAKRNGQEETAEQQLAVMEGLGEMFPSHHVDIDLIVGNRSNGQVSSNVLGVRYIVTATVTPAGRPHFGLDASGPERQARVQDLWFATFVQSSAEGQPSLKLKNIDFAVDGQSMVAQLANPPATLPDISSDHIVAQVKPDTGNHDLAKIVRSWVVHVAAKSCAAHAAEYMHEQVWHWNKGLLSREEMAAHLDGMLGMVGDIEIEIAGLAVDEEKHQVAVRYILHTELVKELAGMKPNGKKVAIPENCFYQFSDGKILAIWAALDMMSFRQQMA
jgi:predicted ester cyclase